MIFDADNGFTFFFSSLRFEIRLKKKNEKKGQNYAAISSVFFDIIFVTFLRRTYGMKWWRRGIRTEQSVELNKENLNKKGRK